MATIGDTRYLPGTQNMTVDGKPMQFTGDFSPGLSPTLQAPAGLRLNLSLDGRGSAIQSASSQEPSATSSGVPQTPAATFQSKLQSIVQTGSASPKMATLVNPTTGDRKAVAVGSQDAQRLFGQGYVLEGANASASASATASATGTTTPPPSMFSTQPPATTGASRIDALRKRAAKSREEAFSAVYGYTPDEWQNLSPETQRRLRNQRVQGIVDELGNINDAIKVALDEEEAAKDDAQKQRENALDTLNLYLKYNVFDQVSSEDKTKLAQATGIALPALEKIASQEEPPKLEKVGSNLYALTYNSKTGQWESKLVQGGGGSGSRGGGDGESFDALARALNNGDVTIADLVVEYDAETANSIKQRAEELQMEADAAEAVTPAASTPITGGKLPYDPFLNPGKDPNRLFSSN